MSDLFVIAFDDEHKAFELRSDLAKMQKEYLIEMMMLSKNSALVMTLITAPGTRRAS